MRVLLAVASLAASSSSAISIGGFTQPTAMSIDASTGRVWVAEREGTIKACPSLNVTTGCSLVADISAQVWAQGDHGLSSILVFQASVC
jgi:hypothetical protein